MDWVFVICVGKKKQKTQKTVKCGERSNAYTLQPITNRPENLRAALKRT